MNLNYFDGTKTYSLTGNSDAYAQVFGPMVDLGSDYTKLYSTVAILNRCIRLRSDAVAHIPFALVKGGKDITTSDDWKDPTGLLPNPFRLFRQIESSLMFTNSAYLLKNRNAYNVTKELQFCEPNSISPQINPTDGLTGFLRMGQAVPADQMIYIWYQDGLTEIGPAEASIVKAAAAAAGVLHYLDNFAASYFKRGAIRATILGVPQGTTREQKDELQSWWERVITGIRNAFAAKVINVDAVKPTVIGDGIDGLSNNGLTQQEREDIAIVTGVPMSMVMSNAANFATAQQDERNLLQWSVLPDAELIGEALTVQAYGERGGYRLEFRPETMDSFQEDEVNRAGAFSQYVSAGVKPSLAAQICGIELPEGIEYEDLDPEPEPEPEPVPPQQLQQAQEQPPMMPEDSRPEEMPADAGRMDAATRKELEIWQRKALKALKAGGTANCEFVVQHIDQATALEIMGELSDCQDAESVKNVFEKRINGAVDPMIYLADEIRKLRLAAEAIA